MTAESSTITSPRPPLFGKLRPFAIAAAVFLVATLVLFGDVLVNNGKVLSLAGTDVFNVFVGWNEFSKHEMLSGNLPLWNPHLFCGAPCLGGFQEALLYPPTWMHLILPTGLGINSEIALHVFLAGIFTYFWVARRGIQAAAAILSGLIFMFGGGYFMHIAPGHLPNLQTMVWAPLIFLAIDDLTSTTSLRGAWMGAAALAMQVLAGHPQYVYYTGLISIPYALICLWSAPQRRRAILGLALMGIGGIALSAVQLLTGLQAAGESLRSGLKIEVASTFPFPPENLLTLVFPGILGTLSDHLYWGRWFVWEDSLFIGTVALVLVIYGVVAGSKSHRRFLILGLLLTCLLVSFGSYTPIYKLLFRFLPGFGSFRGVSKMAFLSGLFFAYLAGIGFDRLLRAERLAIVPAIVMAIAAGALIFAGIGIWHSGNLERAGVWAHAIDNVNWKDIGFQFGALAKGPPNAGFYSLAAHRAAREMFWSAGVLALLATLWFLTRQGRSRRTAIGVLAAIELLVFGWTNRPTFALQDVVAIQDQFRMICAALPPDSRVITGRPSDVLVAGGDEAWGNDPMILRRYAQFIGASLHAPAEDLLQREYPFFPPPAPPLAWGIARVDQVLVPTKKGPRFFTMPHLSRGQLIENAVVIDDPDQLLQTLTDPKFDARRTVLLEKAVTPMPSSAAPPSGSSGNVEVKEIAGETDEVEVTASVRRSSILLITDNYSAGWRVIPVEPSPPQRYEIVPGDFAFRAIALVPGNHHFILEYRPMAYVIGKWVTLVALFAWLAAGVMLWRLRQHGK